MNPFITIRELKKLLMNNEISAEEVLTFYLRRFEAHDSVINSALEIFEYESIMRQTSKGGSLYGIPGLIKDNICQKGRRLSCASKILDGFHSTYDATVIKQLKQEGAFLVGRANLDEFAMGSSTETSAFKKTKNPWDINRVPGGSSGGSAAAVAAGLVPWALGSDTGGSVRQPAGLCGIVGLKPTYGLVSRYGLVAYGSSFDQIGIFTHSVYDAALILSSIVGQDSNDSSSLPVQKKDYVDCLEQPLPKLRIGVIENALNAPGMDTDIVVAIEEAIKELTTLGATIKPIALPTLDYATAAYFILSRAEAASNLARYDGVRYGMRDKKAKTVTTMYTNTRAAGFGDEVKSRIMMGNYVLSAGHTGEFYANAKIVQGLIRQEFINAFKDVDLLVMPTHPIPAFTFGAFDVDKLQMDLQDYFTCPMNLAGIPAISIPCGFTKNKLPIGFQLIGPHLSEELILRVANAY
ncbi:MAG: Asp-tRNA(Asn)/Glu-tRNA(Gln) amidotransferase subunit GatA, partial [Candidatus Babeliales bacterium]